MKRRIVLLITICLFSFCLFLIIETFNKIENKKRVVEKIARLPELMLTSIDSSKVNVDSIYNNKFLVLIVFNTTCDICQHEIVDLLESINKFSKAKIVLISTESIDSIIKFNLKYELNRYPNILLGHVNDLYVSQVLGVEIIPQIFIYDPDKNLIKVYKGETKLEAITKYLQ
jgi:peroxiredoxin